MAKIWPSAIPNVEFEIVILLKKSSNATTEKKEVLAVKEKISYQLIA